MQPIHPTGCRTYLMGMRRIRKSRNRSRRIGRPILWSLGCTLLAIGAASVWKDDPVEISGTVTRSDGDSFWIGDQEIRLFGIDAFEAGQICGTGVQRHDCGSASIVALQELTRRGVTCRGEAFDRYDRLVAVCFADGEDINATMVERGHALAYRRYSRDYIDEERRAKDAKAGVWAGEFQAPWDYRAEN